MPSFHQLPDHTPPAVPTVDSFYFVNDYEVEVKWHEVTDEDLYGYRVYYANGKNGNYMQVTGVPVRGNTYRFAVNQNTEIDSIYLQVAAEDKRQNLSDRSITSGITRPDLHGPSKPAIIKINPLPEGIGLTWRFSPSDDVTKHILQRRNSFEPVWIDIYEILVNDQENYPTAYDSVSYIDSAYNDIIEFEYRLIALDDNFNNAASSPVKATPIRPLVHGDVSEVEIEMESEAAFDDPEIIQQLINLQEEGYKISNTKSPNLDHSLVLKWNYPLDPQLKEFKIYRAMTGGPMSEYRTISLGTAMGLPSSDVTVNGNMGNRTFSFRDEDLMKNRRYTYEIKAVHKDGSVSHRSSTVSLKVPK